MAEAGVAAAHAALLVYCHSRGKFFDSVPWDLLEKAVQSNTTHAQRWTRCR